MEIELLKRYEQVSKAELDGNQKRRTYLGASELGGRCWRAASYSFRWFKQRDFEGRMLRLFDRGHREEFNVVHWLRACGIQVMDYETQLMWVAGSDRYECMAWGAVKQGYIDVSHDPMHVQRATARGDGPKQWGFVDAEGHYRGHGDGAIAGASELIPQVTRDDGLGLLEIKTHGDKSYNDLSKKGMKASKPEHYNQMQQYMGHFGFGWGLYVSVNKNTDHVYFEVVRYNEAVHEHHTDKARRVIQATQLPKRINEDASFFGCRFCDFRQNCHYGEPAERNCRSCTYAQPVEDGAWRCNAFDSIIPDDFIPKGCKHWDEFQ